MTYLIRNFIFIIRYNACCRTLRKKSGYSCMKERIMTFKKNSVELIKFKFEHNDKLSYSNNFTI